MNDIKITKKSSKIPKWLYLFDIFFTIHRNKTMKPTINETWKWTYRYKILEKNRKEKEGYQSIGKINHES